MIPVMTEPTYARGNPGDMYIYWGFRYLLEEAFQKPLPWLILNKFEKSDFVRYKDLIKKAGFVIYAGTPQYDNFDKRICYQDWDLWKEIIIPWALDFYTVAGGAGIPKPGISIPDFVSYVKESKKTNSILNSKRIRTKYCTVRDKYAQALLDNSNTDCKLFPCTAGWSMQSVGMSKKSDKYFAISLPGFLDPDFTFRKDFPAEKHLKFYKALYERVKDRNPILIAHDKRSLSLFDSNYNVFHSSDPISLLKLYQHTKEMVAGRIHAAIPTYTMGDTKIVSLSIDTRGAAVEEFGIEQVSLSQSVDEILNILDNSEPLDKIWFNKITEEYKESLHDGFESVIK